MTFEVDLMDAGAYGFEANALAAERSPNDSHPPLPSDVAAGGDLARRPTATISQWGKLASIRASAVSVELCRYALSKSFMRPLVVVIADEARAALLLASACRGRRGGRLGFVNSMHLFMSGVILR